MKTMYQVFVEMKDGRLSGVADGEGPRWFDTREEAEELGGRVASFGTVSKVWLYECKALAEVAPNPGPPRKEKERPLSADIHIFHEIEAEKSLPGEYNCAGDQCADRLAGTVHSKHDFDEMVTVLHKLGFRVEGSRLSRTPLLSDPHFVDGSE